VLLRERGWETGKEEVSKISADARLRMLKGSVGGKQSSEKDVMSKTLVGNQWHTRKKR